MCSSLKNERTEGSWPDPSVRLIWLDFIKVLSAFAVVMTHIASIGWQAMVPTAQGWFITSVYEIATRFAVPCFFMVSGALMLNPRRCNSNYGSYCRRALHMGLIALTVSFLFFLMQYLLQGWQGWRLILSSTIDGPYFIWYLWVLVGIDLLIPALRAIAEKREALISTLIVLAVFVIGKSTVSAMLPNTLLNIWFDNFILFCSGMEGILYYLLGAFLISSKLDIRQQVHLSIAGLISLVIAIFLNYRSALINGADLYYVARDNLFIAVFSIGFFSFGQLCSRKIQTSRIIKSLSAVGLYIYLIHPFLRLVMEELTIFEPIIQGLLESPLIAVPMVSLIIWALSALIAVPLSKVIDFIRLKLNTAKWINPKLNNS